MLKSIQIKVVLIFLALGIIIISTLGTLYILQLQDINSEMMGIEVINEEEINQITNQKIKQIELLIAYAICVYAIISIIVGLFVSKVVIKPISKLIKNAGEIISGEDIDIKYLSDGKNATEVDELVNAFGMMTSELKERLSEVSRQKKQIETILLHMTDGVIAFNMEGHIMLMNPAATRLLRLLPEDDTFDKIFEKLNININIEKIIYLENLTSSDESIEIGDTHLNISFVQLKDDDNRPTGVMVVIQDIEHIRLDNMRKEFVADVSHELKTPITSIMGYADTLLEGDYEKETETKFLNVIATEARRMAKLVTDLLTLSRYDSDNINIEKTEFDLGDLVKKCQEKLQIEIDKKKHKAECFVTANVPPVYADKSSIERAVLNILMNSIKYTPAGGNIKIYVGFVYNDAYIKIIDNGSGIPEDDLSRIFERFYRVDKARTREMGGTGLGLSIAKEILDKNNGTIDIKSQKGKGTEVVIKIPTGK